MNYDFLTRFDIFIDIFIISSCILSILFIIGYHLRIKKKKRAEHRARSERDIILKAIENLTSKFYDFMVNQEAMEECLTGIQRTVEIIESKHDDSLTDNADRTLINLLEHCNSDELAKFIIAKKNYLVSKCYTIINKGVKSELFNEEFLDIVFSDYKDKMPRFSDDELNILMIENKFLMFDHFKTTILSIKEYANGGSHEILIDKCKDFIKNQLKHDYDIYHKIKIRNQLN